MELKMGEKELLDELCFYTLGHGDPGFIHQLVVDAYAAQNADAGTKNIAIAFSLIGLYLHLEKGFTGRQVQQLHMRMARRRRDWPRPEFPEERGAVRVGEVVAAAPGAERDAAIERWCAAVWGAWQGARPVIVQLAKEYGIGNEGGK